MGELVPGSEAGEALIAMVDLLDQAARGLAQRSERDGWLSPSQLLVGQAWSAAALADGFVAGQLIAADRNSTPEEPLELLRRAEQLTRALPVTVAGVSGLVVAVCDLLRDVRDHDR